MKKAILKAVHINTINVGDIIMFDGVLRTVGKDDIKYSSFMGKTIFGDSFHLGYKFVEKEFITGK